MVPVKEPKAVVGEKKRGPNWAAYLLIGLGLVLVFKNFGVLDWGVWTVLWRLWPVLLVMWGLTMLGKKK